MTAVNFTKPVTSDLRADVLSYIRDYMAGQAKMFDGDTLTSPPTNAIRYSAANSRFELWSGAAWGALTLALLPTTGGTLTGALTSLTITPAVNNTSNLGSDALRYASVYATNFYEAGTALSSKYSVAAHTHTYLPLAGGTLSGVVNSLNILPVANNVSNLGSDTFRYAGVYATSFYEAGSALSSLYSGVGHSHSYLPLAGGTLSGGLSGTTGAFSTSLAVGGVAVSLSTHTHSYLALSGGTLTGALQTAAAGIELGHATDTTLTRLAAGRMAVEGAEAVVLGFSASSAKVTRGTAAPSGGADGDIYLQYA
jgi:hypothetical protein